MTETGTAVFLFVIVQVRGVGVDNDKDMDTCPSVCQQVNGGQGRHDQETEFYVFIFAVLCTYYVRKNP